MFESKLKKISKEVFHNKNLKKYFILTHKKHNREMYFRVGDKKALEFAKSKFNSKKKKIIFYLLEKGLLQVFLKKIKLSKEIGDVIFTGGQIKGFDLDKKIANSFPHIHGTKEDFIKDKKSQVKLGKENFAPKIIRLDEKNCFSSEELFSPFIGNIKFAIDRLFEFYNKNKIKKVKTLSLENKIKKYLKNNKIKDPLFNNALKEIRKIDYFLWTKIHGEFAKEQCLIKNKKIFFVDWSLREGLLTEDLVNYFRLDEEYFIKKEFNILLKKYPAHIKNNLREYLLLTELLRVSQGVGNLGFSKRRVLKLLATSSSSIQVQPNKQPDSK